MFWKSDSRGELLEAFHLPHDGLVFVVKIKPEQTRGHHYHLHKVEKFLVIEGEASLVLKQLSNGVETVHSLKGYDPRLVEITPNTYHYITAGIKGCTLLVWCNEHFDPKDSDTYSIEGVLL